MHTHAQVIALPLASLCPQQGAAVQLLGNQQSGADFQVRSVSASNPWAIQGRLHLLLTLAVGGTTVEPQSLQTAASSAANDVMISRQNPTPQTNT